jgi:hypothetical protein
MRPTIPRFEIEQILAEAKRRGDGEKVSTTSLTEVQYGETTLSSRYGKAEEYETMLDMLEGVAPTLQSKIRLIWCDSKAGAFSVSLNYCTVAEAKTIGSQLDQACLRSANWHNGIHIVGTAGRELYLSADFENDFE